MKLTTTINKIIEHNPSAEYRLKLTEQFGNKFDCNAEINLLDIAGAIDLEFMFWCMRAIDQDIQVAVGNIALKCCDLMFQTISEQKKMLLTFFLNFTMMQKMLLRVIQQRALPLILIQFIKQSITQEILRCGSVKQQPPQRIIVSVQLVQVMKIKMTIWQFITYTMVLNMPLQQVWQDVVIITVSLLLLFM